MRTNHFFYHIYEDFLKWFMGTLLFSTLNCRDFSLFLFPFLRVHKKRKNANKRIGYYFPLRCSLSAFLIFVCLFAFCAFAWLCFCDFCTFCVFRCFWCFLGIFGAFGACEIFSLKKKKKITKSKEFKTALITSFILLLSFILICFIFYFCMYLFISLFLIQFLQ